MPCNYEALIAMYVCDLGHVFYNKHSQSQHRAFLLKPIAKKTQNLRLSIAQSDPGFQREPTRVTNVNTPRYTYNEYC